MRPRHRRTVSKVSDRTARGRPAAPGLCVVEVEEEEEGCSDGVEHAHVLTVNLQPSSPPSL